MPLLPPVGGGPDATGSTVDPTFDPVHASFLQFLYVPPTQLFIETIFYVLVGYVLYRGGQREREAQLDGQSIGDRVSRRAHTRPRSTLDLIVGLSLTFGLLLHAYYKLARPVPPGPLPFHPDVFFMTQPCHVSAAIYAYVLLTNDADRGEYWYNIGFHYIYGTLLAMATPDLKGKGQFGEVEAFWVQHILIAIAPFYLLATRRYRLYSSNWTWGIAIGYACFFHNLIQLPLSVALGINYNYMIQPPPGQPFAGRFYKPFLGTFQAIVCFVFGRWLPKQIEKIAGWDKH
jgi:hypothetical protein